MLDMRLVALMVLVPCVEIAGADLRRKKQFGQKLVYSYLTDSMITLLFNRSASQVAALFYSRVFYSIICYKCQISLSAS